MGHLVLLVLSVAIAACFAETSNIKTEKTLLSTVLTTTGDASKKTLQRQGRSYYYGPYYDRLVYARDDYDGPSRCGRCDDRYDSDRSRDRYDDDRGLRHRPTYGSRRDRNRDDDDDDDRSDRRTDKDSNTHKNGTTDDNDPNNKRKNDDDDKSSGSRRGSDRHRDRGRDRDRDRYDDRDKYRPDYYDRFLRDPYKERRPYYDERRPYDRVPYEEGYGGRYDGYGYPGYRRPSYEDRYDRGNGYDDGYGGYGPGVGRGPHDSFRPWDETYRGQAGWDAGGRGYYFASGRPEIGAAPAQGWARPDYGSTSSGWQSVYRDPLEYRGSVGYAPEPGYRQGIAASYGASSGWQNVGERRPYRDQSGISQYDKGYGQSWNDVRYGQTDPKRPSYGQSYGADRRPAYGAGERPGYGRPDDKKQSAYDSADTRQPGYGNADARPTYGSDARPTYGSGDARPAYDSADARPAYGSRDARPAYGGADARPTYGSDNRQPAYPSNARPSYGQYDSDQQGAYGSYGSDRQNHPSYSNSDRQYGVNSGTLSYGKTTTTPATSYLYEREDEQVTTKSADDVTTKPPA